MPSRLDDFLAVGEYACRKTHTQPKLLILQEFQPLSQLPKCLISAIILLTFMSFELSNRVPSGKPEFRAKEAHFIQIQNRASRKEFILAARAYYYCKP
jgi:hypothetical protein